ncbi:hypothetical protein ERO13_D11G226501v2 [Gossypium hirsutum]|uniref:ATP synthase subunit delta', mitochondrial isoform X1 n=2 Tax=Gossypium TaxID=3633 RepID=A0A1U8JWY2_GOSHI|nr:ATP synthase subunit delta', mitochondrial isoform X1 [Gossypium hirsutum]KAG4121753.1 hypothetical protein ERO13_D11G226501v2 [Gossypium hirsutum]TYI56996.1 hypothetical protein E1A91_D11G249800v1 [Gossypium mustelinum]
MLRPASMLLARRPILAARARSFSTDLPAAPFADATFTEACSKVIPNMEPPKTPLSFMQPHPPTPSSIPSKLTVHFVLPYASELATIEIIGKLNQLESCRSTIILSIRHIGSFG